MNTRLSKYWLHSFYSRQFDEHILKVTLLKSNLLLISSEQIMLLIKDFTAFFFNSCETIHVMNILGGGRSYLEPKGKELSQVFCCCCCCKTIKVVLNLLFLGLRGQVSPLVSLKYLGLFSVYTSARCHPSR